MKISLLHATFGAGAEAVEVRDAWIRSAQKPRRVEHLFAADADDEVSMNTPEIAAGIIGDARPGMVTAIRNWNAAAAASTGDLIVVIADDLWPSPGWDSSVESLCRDLDPQRAAFVIKVRDSTKDRHDLIRHPIISRRYLERFGLWHAEYEGYLADNDFTLSAHRRNVVIDGTNLCFDHRHPLLGHESTKSHGKMLGTRLQGRRVFSRRWPLWKRRLLRVPLRPRPGQVVIPAHSRIYRAALARTGYLAAIVPSGLRERLRRRLKASITRDQFDARSTSRMELDDP